MSKANGGAADDELDQELRATMASGLGALFEDQDRVSIRTHSGGIFDGTVEDSNLAGVLLRTDDKRLFFVSFAGIEHAEIFEGEQEGDGEDADEDATKPDGVDGDAGGSDVTPISPARAS